MVPYATLYVLTQLMAKISSVLLVAKSLETSPVTSATSVSVTVQMEPILSMVNVALTVQLIFTLTPIQTSVQVHAQMEDMETPPLTNVLLNAQLATTWTLQVYVSVTVLAVILLIMLHGLALLPAHLDTGDITIFAFSSVLLITMATQ